MASWRRGRRIWCVIVVVVATDEEEEQKEEEERCARHRDVRNESERRDPNNKYQEIDDIEEHATERARTGNPRRV